MEHRRERRGRRLTTAGAVLGLVAASAFAVIIVVGTAPPARGIGVLSFPLLWATPAVLALQSLRDRPILLVPAAILGLLLSFTALSGITLVLLIPSLCFVMAYGALARRVEGLAQPLLAILVPVLACAGAFAIMLADAGSVCWTYVEDARGERTYDEVACGQSGEIGPVLSSGPATTLVPSPTSDSGAGASGSHSLRSSSGPNSSGSGSFGSELVRPPRTPPGPHSGPAVVGSGGGSTSTASFPAVAAGAILLASGLAAAWALAGHGRAHG